MNEEPRSSSEMLELVHRRAAVIRARRRRLVILVQSMVACAVLVAAFVVLRRPDGSSVVVPGSSSSVTERSIVNTSTSPSTTPSTSPSNTSAPPAQRVVEPIGATGGLYGIRLTQTSIVSTPLSGHSGQQVLRYSLQVDVDAGGQGGTISADTTTDDGQLQATLGCQPNCVFAADAPLVTTDVIIDAVGPDVSDGVHTLPMSLTLVDGTAYPFSAKFVVNTLAGDDVVRQIAESSGLPVEAQHVVGVGGFAYHLTYAFGSMWIVGKGSETLTRIDARTGQIEATIRLSAGQTNRVTATDEAIYVSGSPVTRIDPADNSVTTIELPANSLGIIGDHERVWAAGRYGVERIDSSGSVTALAVPDANWIDLAVSNDLVWAVSQERETGRVIAFDGQTGDVRYDIAITEGQPNSAAVRLVADESSVVVGIDTSGLGGRTGEVVVIDPTTGSISSRVALDSRPEGIALTDRHIWTSAAVLDRATLAIAPQSFGFSIALGSDGSIWATRHSAGPNEIDIGEAIRYAPGDFAG